MKLIGECSKLKIQIDLKLMNLKVKNHFIFYNFEIITQ